MSTGNTIIALSLGGPTRRSTAHARILVPINRITVVHNGILQVHPVGAVRQIWAIESPELGAHVEPVLVNGAARLREADHLIEIRGAAERGVGNPNFGRFESVPRKQPRPEGQASQSRIPGRYSKA